MAAAGYPHLVNIRFTTQDLAETDELARRLRTPRSVLIRRVWQEWLDTQPIQSLSKPIEKTAS